MYNTSWCFLTCLTFLTSLSKLHLRFCGRGLAPDVLAATLGACPPMTNLTTLVLEGAYRVTDEGLLQWLQLCPGLLHLQVLPSVLLCPPADDLVSFAHVCRHVCRHVCHV